MQAEGEAEGVVEDMQDHLREMRWEAVAAMVPMALLASACWSRCLRTPLLYSVPLSPSPSLFLQPRPRQNDGLAVPRCTLYSARFPSFPRPCST